MIKANRNIVSVKREVERCKGENVFVKVNLGRNKYEVYTGKLDHVYPSLFTILPDGEYKGKTVFSYAELACGNVRLKLKK